MVPSAFMSVEKHAFDAWSVCTRPVAYIEMKKTEPHRVVQLRLCV